MLELTPEFLDQRLKELRLALEQRVRDVNIIVGHIQEVEALAAFAAKPKEETKEETSNGL